MNTSPGDQKVVLDSSMTRVVNSVPVQTRSERFHSTNPEAFPVVSGREPEWRLSPVKELTALITGSLDGSDYAISATKDDAVTVEFEDSASVGRGTVSEPEDRLAANAWSQVDKTLVVTVSGEAGTVTLERSDLGNVPRAAHTVIKVAENATATLIVRSSGAALLAENVEIELEKGSSLQMVSVQEWDDDAIHYASHFARVGEGASLTHIVATMGGHIVVVNPSTELAGENATGELYGVYFAEAHQHLESRVYVHHVGADTTSNVSYKGALHGKGARTVWVGDVLIGAEATGTDSYEQNRNLVLSDGTRADSIPNLEIKTGDIAGAGHASATGRFDDEHLFYLQSRGIPEVQARRLVVGGFLGEIVQKIDDQELQDHLIARIQQKLRDTEESPE
jgi:Fe-S cluster assembly protein SufD